MNDAARSGQRTLPRLTMLREITDRAVLDEVFAHGRVTRTDLASSTGISKPTISESVRRLEAAGILTATGSRTTGRRGRVATFYELAAGAGHVLAVEMNQSGVHTMTAGLDGQDIGERRTPPGDPGDGAALVAALRESVLAATGEAAEHGPLRAMALSVANPVDPATREIIALPDSPFPEAPLRPAHALADLVRAPILVDNDVNWAALAERRRGAAADAGSFAYVHIGAGLGMGLYIGDQLVRGAHGLAGEIGYLSMSSPAGSAPLAQALSRQGFGRPDAPSNDVPAVLATIARAEAGDPAAGAAVLQISAIIAEIVADTCAVLDPELVLLGGPIGGRPALLAPTRAAVARLTPIPVHVRLGALGDGAALRGALTLALDRARSGMLGTAG